MDQAGGVDRLESGQELRGDVARLLQVQRASLAQHVGQRHAVHVLHRHQLAAVELDEVEHAADVRRDNLARRAHFLAQAGQRALVGEQPVRTALSATSTRSLRSKARNTSPMPPRPSRERTR